MVIPLRFQIISVCVKKYQQAKVQPHYWLSQAWWLFSVELDTKVGTLHQEWRILKKYLELLTSLWQAIDYAIEDLSGSLTIRIPS